MERDMADERPPYAPEQSATEWALQAGYVYGASHEHDPDGGYLRACYAAMGQEMPPYPDEQQPDVVAAATAAINSTTQPHFDPPVPQFPRDWVSPWVGIMARAELRHLNDARELAGAELRARLVAKVREKIVGVAWDEGGWVDFDAMAEIAVDVFTEAVRKGEL